LLQTHIKPVYCTNLQPGSPELAIQADAQQTDKPPEMWRKEEGKALRTT